MIVVPAALRKLDGMDAVVNGTAKPAEELEQRAAAQVVVD